MTWFFTDRQGGHRRKEDHHKTSLPPSAKTKLWYRVSQQWRLTRVDRTYCRCGTRWAPDTHCRPGPGPLAARPRPGWRQSGCTTGRRSGSVTPAGHPRSGRPRSQCRWCSAWLGWSPGWLSYLKAEIRMIKLKVHKLPGKDTWYRIPREISGNLLYIRSLFAKLASSNLHLT